jgi:hypothetical protein
MTLFLGQIMVVKQTVRIMESNEVAKGTRKPMDVVKLTMKHPDLEQPLMKT